uniref:Uncharacterized protein n=2 Tax=Myripristis murdjan TaxID=586833 RepID=A0A667W918_9TELE
DSLPPPPPPLSKATLTVNSSQTQHPGNQLSDQPVLLPSTQSSKPAINYHPEASLQPSKQPLPLSTTVTQSTTILQPRHDKVLTSSPTEAANSGSTAKIATNKPLTAKPVSTAAIHTAQPGKNTITDATVTGSVAARTPPTTSTKTTATITSTTSTKTTATIPTTPTTSTKTTATIPTTPTTSTKTTVTIPTTSTKTTATIPTPTPPGTSPATTQKTTTPTTKITSTVKTTVVITSVPAFKEPASSSSSSSSPATQEPKAPTTEMPLVQFTSTSPVGTPATTSHGTGPSASTTDNNQVVAKGTRVSVVEVAGDALTSHLVDTASLLAVLLFGLLFFLVTVAVFVTQAYESYRRKDYTQVDYLINGMYTDSGV